jgi:hypothetical protein
MGFRVHLIIKFLNSFWLAENTEGSHSPHHPITPTAHHPITTTITSFTHH